MPPGFSRSAPGPLASGLDVLQHELAAERAAALGRSGARVEASLERLRAHEPAGASGQDRTALLLDAADAVWCFFVQRELCGLNDQAEVIAHYRIPREVLARLGAR